MSRVHLSTKGGHRAGDPNGYMDVIAQNIEPGIVGLTFDM